MNINQASVTREQKEAVGLLSVGTFLEYFDLMLYVHMAVLLNDLFFPKMDPFSSQLLSAFTFCSTYVFRPIGALIFGWIGDNIGRRHTIVITTMMMAISNLVMANAGTYEQIGIAASWIITICRIMQGMSSMGEIIGAEIYITETVQLPYRYCFVTTIAVFATIGGMAALGVASVVTSYALSWRIAFWVGTIISIVGVYARTALRETPDFVNAKKRYLKNLDILKNKYYKIDQDQLKKHPMLVDKVAIKSFISLFFVGLPWPVCLYIGYIHMGNVLKYNCGYSSIEVINQNFYVAVLHVASYIITALLTLKVHPFKIIKFKIPIFIIGIIFMPYLLDNVTSGAIVFYMQLFIIIFALSGIPASAVFYKSFPIFFRFKSCTLTYALSRAIMNVVTSFGMIYLIKLFGNKGILLILVPIAILFIYGINHFMRLMQENPSKYV